MPSISQKGQRMPASPIRKLVPFAEAAKKRVQLLMFASPVIFPMALFAKHPTMQVVLSLNPMAPVINAVRTMFFGGQMDWIGLGFASAAALVLMLVALAMFQRVERSFADVV